MPIIINSIPQRFIDTLTVHSIRFVIVGHFKVFIPIYTPHKWLYFQLQPLLCACKVNSELVKKDYIGRHISHSLMCTPIWAVATQRSFPCAQMCTCSAILQVNVQQMWLVLNWNRYPTKHFTSKAVLINQELLCALEYLYSVLQTFVVKNRQCLQLHCRHFVVLNLTYQSFKSFIELLG